MESVQAGDFSTTQGRYFGFGTRNTFRGAGKTVDAPATLPAAKGDLVTGRFYLLPGGEVAEWTGSKFRIARTERLLSSDNSRVEDEDLDEEEDE
jgi:hypothetical protein